MAAAALSRSGRWRMRRLAVCASTELELDRWLAELGPEPDLGNRGLVVVARRQRHGRGQRGRQWVSPAGGLWLSAAMHWPARQLSLGAPLTLTTALGLCLELEALGLQPQIKWPNDVLLEGRKLAGILARLRLQGQQVRWAQVGLGLNGINRVPAGAIALGEALQRAQPGRFHPLATPRSLLPRALAALHWSQSQALCREGVLDAVAQRLCQQPPDWRERLNLSPADRA